VRQVGRRRKKPYPHDSDIAEALLRVLVEKPLLHPQDLVDEIRRELEEQGFYAGLVNARRVWRIYRRLVERGRMPDVLMVMSDSDYGSEYC